MYRSLIYQLYCFKRYTNICKTNVRMQVFKRLYLQKKLGENRIYIKSKDDEPRLIILFKILKIIFTTVANQ